MPIEWPLDDTPNTPAWRDLPYKLRMEVISRHARLWHDRLRSIERSSIPKRKPSQPTTH